MKQNPISPKKWQWTVSPNESGKLLAFLKAKLGPNYSSRKIKQAIETNYCEINGRVERFASVLVGAGDRVVFCDQERPESDTTSSKNSSKNSLKVSSASILYEDPYLCIYNKPAGMISEAKELALAAKGTVVHRLDRETTGALIFARTADVKRKLLELFKQHQVMKCYVAIVDGVPVKKQGVIENRLGKLHEYQGQTLWGEVSDGLRAYTEWSLEKRGEQASLVRCWPRTGRTHQLRVHLSGLGHPILGDYQYGRIFRCRYRPGRYLLHALSVSFVHPVTGEKLVVEAPLFEDMLEAMKELKL